MKIAYSFNKMKSRPNVPTIMHIKSTVLKGSRTRLRLIKRIFFALCIISMATYTWAQNPSTDYTAKTLEDLMAIEVTSVSKKEERLFHTAAAVYVITQEDIRRSGMTSIPDLLRLVPGLNVARIDGTKWAISARGFNGRFADKLLVLIDGRSIYSPETSGVWWEVQDLLLEDIERIEVIRGPGGTLWGANAVNGVINIITKRAQDTQGSLVTLGGGSEERGLVGVHYGGKVNERAYYRIYGKYFNRSGLVDATGHNIDDKHNALRGGGRIDWQLTDLDSLTLQGDIYRSHLREIPTTISASAPFALPTNTRAKFTGGNVLGRWTHAFSEQSDAALRIYYDRFSRDIFDLPERNNTFDVDFQHHLAVGRRQDIVWGLGYRLLWDGTDSTIRTPVQYTPKEKTVQLFNVFVHDEITLIKDQLRMMVGSKIEHNHYSGFEIQPSVRASWTPTARQTVWGAVARAAATTSRKDEDIRVNVAAIPIPNGPPAIVALFGNPNFKSQEVIAYEAGYRTQAGSNLSIDLAAFYNVYDHLRTLEPGTPFFENDPQPPHMVIPLMFDNLMQGKTYGTEISANANITRGWRLAGSYSFLRAQLRRYAESLDTSSKEAGEGNNPQHQFQLHSYLRLKGKFELDASLYHVSRLPNIQVPHYSRFDVRVGKRFGENVEFSICGQNLLDGRHLEFTGPDIGALSSQVRPSAYAKLIWKL